MAQPADPGSELADALAAYQLRIQALRTQVEAYVRRLWRSLSSYRNADMARFVKQAVPVVLGAQHATAALTTANLALQRQIALGGRLTPAAIDLAKVTGAAARNGTDPADVYGRPFHLVWRQLDELPRVAGSIEAAFAAGEQRAVELALDDQQLAKQHAALEVLGHDDRATGYRRVLEGAHSCGLCLVASTQRYHRAQLLPMHGGCVLGGTLVAVPASRAGEPGEGGPIEAATRRRYHGEAVVLHTAAGNLLTVTPNHPVLTPSGWAPAGLLREGDEVVRSAVGDRVVGRVPHEHEVPTVVEDCFRALAVDGLVAVPLAAEDFHGDVADYQVGVVPADSLLGDRRVAALAELVGELTFSLGVVQAAAFARESHLAPFAIGVGASGGSMGSSGLGGALLGGHALGALYAGLRPVTHLVPSVPDSLDQGGPVDAVLAAELQRGHAFEIAGDGLWRNHGTRTKFDAPTTEFEGQGALVHADRGRRLMNRLAGQIQPDRLVSVSRINLAASHVYNLQTAEGWYSANGIIVSNCDCSVAAIYGKVDHGRALAATARVDGRLVPIAELPDVHDRIAQRFGASSSAGRTVRGTRDAHGRILSYRDALVTHDHGELGAVLSVRGAGFTGPNDLTK